LHKEEYITVQPECCKLIHYTHTTTVLQHKQFTTVIWDNVNICLDLIEFNKTSIHKWNTASSFRHKWNAIYLCYCRSWKCVPIPLDYPLAILRHLICLQFSYSSLTVLITMFILIYV